MIKLPSLIDDVNSRLLLNYIKHVGFEVLTVMTMKGAIFWGVMPGSLVGVRQRFGGIYSIIRVEYMLSK
jgi:hypothetical protein